MKIKSEKGYTGVDIAISIIVLFIFVSIIATLSYKFNSTFKAIELKADATEIAIEEVEKIKNELSFEEIKDMSQANGNSEYISQTEVDENEGFFETITVQDYNDIDKTKTQGLVKKVTVKIEYKFKNNVEAVELSTIISKEI
jgi:hypothetical protein